MQKFNFQKQQLTIMTIIIYIEQNFFYMPVYLQMISLLFGQLFLAFYATNISISNLSFLFPFVIGITIFKYTSLILITIFYIQKEPIIPKLENPPPIISVVIKLIALESQLNYAFLLQPYLHIIYEYNMLPFTILFSFLIVGFNYLKLFVSDQQLFPLKGFEKIETSLFDFIILSLKIVQVSLYYYYSIVNTICLFFIALFQLLHIYFNMPYPRYTELFILSSAFHFTVVLTQFTPNKFELTIILFLSPFLGNALLIIWQNLGKNSKFKISQIILQDKQTDLTELLKQVKEDIYYISTLNQLNKTIEAFFCVNQLCQKKNLHYLSFIKADLLRQQIKLKLQYRYMNDPNSEVNKFLIAESKNQSLKDKIQRLILEKIEFYQHFKQLSSKQLFQKAKQLSKNLEIMEIQLKNMYEKYPSSKLQSVSTFFQTEVLGNFLQAHKFSNLTTISDEKLMNINLFSDKMAYIMTIFEEDRMEIINLSNHASDYFNMDLKKQKSINILLPNAIKQFHQQIVVNFMEKGDSKFFRHFNKNFFRKDDFLIVTEFFFDSVNSEQLSFVVFFRQIQDDQSKYIMVDQKGKISDITQNFFAENCEAQNALKGLQIEYLIPSFKELTCKKRHFDQNIYMLKGDMMDLTQSEQNVKKKYRRLQSLWKRDDSTETYLANFFIYSSNLEKYPYYIIEFDDIRKLNNLTQSTRNIESHIKFQYGFEISELEQSEEGNIRAPNEILFQKPIFQDDIFPQHLDVQLNKPDLYDLFSPNQSMSRLVAQANQSQQIYFANDLIQPFSDDKEDLAKVEMNLENNNPQSSEQSSLAGMRQSKNYRKYELIHKIITKKLYPSDLLAMNLFFGLMIFVTAIFSLIMISDYMKDYERFLIEIDMLQIKSLFLAPCDEFLATRYALFNYNGMKSRGELDPEEYKKLVYFPRARIPSGYYDLKVNFNKMLKNPSLNEFFLGKTTVVQMMKSQPTDLQKYNISFRASLNILLNYQFNFKISYLESRPITGTPMITYTFVNFYELVASLDQMNEEIQEYTLMRVNAVQDKWFVLLGPFAAFGFLLNILSWSFYRNYIRRIEKQLNLFNFMTEIDLEKERLKHLQTQLDKILFKYKFDLQAKEDAQKESQKVVPITAKKFERKPVYLPKAMSIFIFTALFSVWIIMISIMTYITMQYLIKYKPTTYLYREMSDLGDYVPATFARREVCYNFKIYPFFTQVEYQKYLGLIQEGLDAIQRFNQQMYNFHSEKYLASDQFIQFMTEVKQHDVCSYLDDVLSKIEQYTNQNMKNYSKNYCDNMFGGSLRRGLLPTFQAMVSQMQSEIKINNFTKRLGPVTQDLEASVISVQVVKQLTSQLKDGMTEITFITIKQLQYLSYSYLLYAIILFLSMNIVVRKYFFSEFHLAKRFLLLFPSANLFGNDQLERQIRQIAKLDHII